MKKEKLNKINVGIHDSTLYAESVTSKSSNSFMCVRPQKRDTQKGITLVALVITIIVMLLLSVVSINLIQNLGLIEKVKLAKEDHRASTIQEQKELFEKEIEISKYDGSTPKTINDLLDKLEEEKLITEEEKNTIMQTGRITIGTKEIIFDKIILPEGYTRCEYLESTGTQYIDTGMVVNPLTDCFEICSNILNAQVGSLYGAYESMGINKVYAGITYWNNKYNYFFYSNAGSGWDTTAGVKAETTSEEYIPFFKVKLDKGKIYYNDIYKRDLSSNFNGRNPSKSFYLFKTNGCAPGSKFTKTLNQQVKRFFIKKNNELAMNLIPCLDNNNTPCMYDTVSGKTFYNQGTGEFIAGPISEVLPKGYTRCAYLESTGTQCIDTEFVPKINAKLEMELKFDGDFQAIEGNPNVRGVSDTQSHFSLNFGEGEGHKNTLFCWCEYISKDENKIRSLKITDDIRLNRNKIVFQSEKIIYENLSANMATRNSENDDSLAIFGRKSNGVYYPFKAYNMYLYSCKLYNGEELERNLIPCLDINNTPCMYDTVSGKTFYNQGTGEFIAGPVVE